MVNKISDLFKDESHEANELFIRKYNEALNFFYLKDYIIKSVLLEEYFEETKQREKV